MSENPKLPLDQQQIDFFQKQGYVIVKDALKTEALVTLKRDLEEWVEESRAHSDSYGHQLDGRARFSLEPGHSSLSPALRRVASPIEISNAYLNTIRDAPAVDAVSQLIGPDVQFSNSKINLKHPGAATAVKFHQDFCFEAHTNDSLITVLYFLDDVGQENGPLEVVPGSHRGPLYDHWHDGVFTGAVSQAVSDQVKTTAIPCYGPAGSACLMHTRLVHGSAANLSPSPRSLFIVAYAAADAHPLHKNHIPSRYEGEIVRGQAANGIRSSSYTMQLPEYPTESSFFEQQVSAKN